MKKRKDNLECLAYKAGLKYVMVEHHKKGLWRVFAWDYEMPRLLDGKGGWRPVTGIVSYEDAVYQVKTAHVHINTYPGLRG